MKDILYKCEKCNSENVELRTLDDTTKMIICIDCENITTYLQPNLSKQPETLVDCLKSLQNSISIQKEFLDEMGRILDKAKEITEEIKNDLCPKNK